MFNVGGIEPIAHRDLVELLIDVAGTGRYRFVEWPPEKKAIDIGNFYADSSLYRDGRSAGSRARRCATAWRATLEFYRAHISITYVPATGERVGAP